MFSRDATADIIDGLTDSSSTYTIDAINSVVKSHVLKVSTPKIKKNRIAFCSKWDTFANIKNAAGVLSHPRISLCFQKALAGLSVTYFPWYNACIAAGMQAGGFYKALVHKYANIISAIDPSGFDANNIGYEEDALESGLLFLERTPTGYRWVSDQTTYGFDSNFVYNSIQAMYMADTLALDLSLSYDNAFVGQSLADVDASTALSFLASKMEGYRKLKMIAPSDDAPVGYKNARISINGPIMEIFVEVKLATALYFIPITIEFSQISSTAAQA